MIIFTKGVKVTQNSYDFENVKVGRTETGRSYAIIPTTVAMEVNGQAIETKVNQWHLKMKINGTLLILIKILYFLSKVCIPI